MTCPGRLFSLRKITRKVKVFRTMHIGIVGLGRMGANMARRLMLGGHQISGFDFNAETVKELAADGAVGADSLEALVQSLPAPRAVWVMVPAGDATESTVAQLADMLQPGDIIIDGGNSHYKDDARRSKQLKERDLNYVDVGTSGGLWGLERGYCLMIGGDEKIFKHLEPIFKTLAPGKGDIETTPGREGAGTADQGYIYCGPAGAGHFVKMIHNGIEYGMMQAFAEGFDIMKNASSESLPEELRYNLNLTEIAEVWRRGSVVSSWLLDLAAIALTEAPDLSNFSGYVQDSGEGRWTVEAAVDEAIPAHVLTAALYARFRSRQDNSFADRLLSALRFQFGGHQEKPQS